MYYVSREIYSRQCCCTASTNFGCVYVLGAGLERSYAAEVDVDAGWSRVSGSQVAGVGAAAETPRSRARSRGSYSLLHISAEASLHHGVHRVYMDGTQGHCFRGSCSWGASTRSSTDWRSERASAVVEIVRPCFTSYLIWAARDKGRKYNFYGLRNFAVSACRDGPHVGKRWAHFIYVSGIYVS